MKKKKKKDWPNAGLYQGGRQEQTFKWMTKTEVIHCWWAGGEKCALKCVLSGLSAEQHQREEMEEEKCGEDRKVWWWGGGKKQKSLLHVRMCTSLLLLCTVLLRVLCLLTCVWFCVGVTFCFTFLVFSSRLPHYFPFSLFLSRSFCVHHTWVKQPSQTLQLVLSHTGAEELLFVILAKTNCTRGK